MLVRDLLDDDVVGSQLAPAPWSCGQLVWESDSGGGNTHAKLYDLCYKRRTGCVRLSV